MVSGWLPTRGGGIYAELVAQDPTERWTRLAGRHLSILSALIDRQLESLGVEVPMGRLRDARAVLAEATVEELAALAERIDEEFVRRWSIRPEEDREGPAG